MRSLLTDRALARMDVGGGRTGSLVRIRVGSPALPAMPGPLSCDLVARSAATARRNREDRAVDQVAHARHGGAEHHVGESRVTVRAGHEQVRALLAHDARDLAGRVAVAETDARARALVAELARQCLERGHVLAALAVEALLAEPAACRALGDVHEH